MAGRKLAAMLLLGCCAHAALAKTFEVDWGLPANGLALPSVSTAKCGDFIRFKCAPGASHGVYKLAAWNFNGTCPTRYDMPEGGKVLAEPAAGCDVTIGPLEHEPDYFLVSQTPGACERNLKVHVHTTCLERQDGHGGLGPNSFGGSLASGPASLDSADGLPGVVRPSQQALAGADGLPASGYAGAAGTVNLGSLRFESGNQQHQLVQERNSAASLRVFGAAAAGAAAVLALVL